MPAEVSYHDVLQSGKGPGEDDKDADEHPRDTSWQFVRVFSFVDQQGGWSQAIMQVKTGDGMWRSCTDVGTCGLQSCGQILANIGEEMGNEHSAQGQQLWGNTSVSLSCVIKPHI